MIRLRWSDAQPDDAATPIHWTSAAVITATLFLNVPFWFDHGLQFWEFCCPSLAIAIFPIVGLAIAAAFYLGPALLCHRSKQKLFDVIDTSFGVCPGGAIRLCAAWFLTAWLSKLIAWPVARMMPLEVEHRTSEFELAAVTLFLLIFLIATGLRNITTSAKLASFTCKLSLAVLAAAMIRVWDGLPDALRVAGEMGQYRTFMNFRQEFSFFCSAVCPLVFFSAAMAQRLSKPRAVIDVGAYGIGATLTGTLLLTSILGYVTNASSSYQPSLSPTIAMALFSHVAGSALWSRATIAMVTIFGAARFGVRALDTCLPRRAWSRRITWLFLAAIITWGSLYPFAFVIDVSLRLTANCLAAAAGVLSAIALRRPRFNAGKHPVEVRAVIALGSGIVTAIVVAHIFRYPHDWWRPEFLPAYATSFLVTLALR